MEINVMVNTYRLRGMLMRIRWHQSLQSYMWDVRVKQLNCDKGTNG
jgi:hypothetical protein